MVPLGAGEVSLFCPEGWLLAVLSANMIYEGGRDYMTVVLQPGESQEQLLKRFRKSVQKAGILSTARRKRWYTSPSEVRRLKRAKAIRRERRRQRKRRRRQARW